jgi:hypothetical protein
VSLLRPLLAQLIRRGVPLDVAERKIREEAGRGRNELTAAERMRLSKLRFAQENDLAGTHEDYLIARAEQWTGMDIAPPPDDRWLVDPNAEDDSYLELYRAPGPPRPSDQLRGGSFEDSI